MNFLNLLNPQTLKIFLDNKIKDGKLISEIEIFLNKNGTDLKNFIAKGKVKNLKAGIFK